MKNYLYLDTCKNLTIGLFDEEGEWKGFQFFENVKSSQVLHRAIFDILTENKIKIENLDAVVSAAGPGSYTGMRVSEGLCQVVSWQGIPVYSFYHFEIPNMMGVKEGLWASQAFKGEYFLYSWNETSSKKELLVYDELEALLDKGEGVYSHHEGELDRESELTSGAIKSSAKILVDKVIGKSMRCEPFYYRSLESEFAPSKK